MYRRAILPVADSLIREIKAIDGVTAAGRSTIGIATFGMNNVNLTAPGAAESVELELHQVDPHFFETMGIDLLAGRGFAEGRAMDDATVDGFSATPEADAAALARRGYSVILNAAAARSLGFAEPRQAVGKILKADDGDVEANGQTPVTVIGVVGDSRFRSIREPISPTVFTWDRQAPGWLLVRYSGSPHLVRARDREGLEAPRPRRPVRGGAWRGHNRQALCGRSGAGLDLHRFRRSGGADRLPRPVRPRRVQRGAAHSRDRNPQGAWGANPRHRPASALAVQPAGPACQFDRLAGRLVGDARLAERVRRADRADSPSLPRRRSDRPRSSRPRR